MTKNFHKEIKLAMKAGMYQDLSTREKAIYKNGFRNGFRKRFCISYLSDALFIGKVHFATPCIYS